MELKKVLFKNFLLLIAAGLVIAGVLYAMVIVKSTGNDKPIDENGLISREVLFGNPDKSMVQISPDGKMISYLAPHEGDMNVFAGPTDRLGEMQPITNDRGRGITSYGWTYDNEHILYRQDQAGDENWRIYSVNVNTKIIKDLTPFKDAQARVQAVSYLHPKEVLIAINNRVPELHDIYRVNIETTARELVIENEGFVGYVIDDDYNIRMASKSTVDGGKEYFIRKDDSWEFYEKVGLDDTITTSILGFDKSGDNFYMFDSRNSNTSGLFSVNINTREKKLLHHDPRADVSSIMVHPTEKNVQSASVNYLRDKRTILDESIRADFEYLETVSPGDVRVISRTLDDKTWILVYVKDDGPAEYYKYDRGAKKAEFLFTNREILKDAELAKMHPVVIKSRDGLDMVSYLTLPPKSDPDGDGTPRERLPLVMVVHGGPWSRDSWGYNGMHQWLANRGYAVLSVNFRASTGFGKDFVNAGNLEFGAKMHEDILDGVNWAVEQGIADPDHVAIMGGSYGGYETLWAMTQSSDVFACGVDIVGMSNLITLLESIPPYWKPQLEQTVRRIGDYRTEEGRELLKSRSPLTYAANIEKPLLIGQGANDPRVKQAESDQIVNKMREKGIPVTYALYPDEGHGFVRPENNISFFAITEAFLAECLGGEHQKIGNDFKGSSITVPVGGEYVPGVREALEGK